MSCAVVLVATLAPAFLVADGRRALTAALTAVVPLAGGWSRDETELLGNVVLFIPFGVLGVVLTGLRRRAGLVPLAGAGLSAVLEALQGLLPGRITDPTDVMTNTLGTVLGTAVAVLVGVLLRPTGRSRPARPSARHRDAASGAVADGPWAGRNVRRAKGGGSRPPRKAPSWLTVAVLAVTVVVVGTAWAVREGSVPTAAPTTTSAPALPAGPAATSPSSAAGTSDPRSTTSPGAVEEGASGAVPTSGISAFDDSNPAIGNLDPALRSAVQAAATDAEQNGTAVKVTSGWRSADYQRALFQRAVAEHGSVQEARKFVLPPELSSHVTGHAVDVGPTDAAYWFSQHGNQYGLCQVYANEVWHYELATTPGGKCPAPLPNALSVQR